VGRGFSGEERCVRAKLTSETAGALVDHSSRLNFGERGINISKRGCQDDFDLAAFEKEIS